MPGNRKKNHETGQLSIDFVIGFTIFMIAFIFVSTMISGLLINIHTREIDYDAVAYRTGVVLVEDPGEPSEWNLLDLAIQEERDNLKRLGLGIARNNPGILMESKIEKFSTQILVRAAILPACVILRTIHRGSFLETTPIISTLV